MSTRVLSTDTARHAVTQVKAIVGGGLTEQITALQRQGSVLSDPAVWDGNLAQRFRGDVWPQTDAALRRMLEALATLQRDVDSITASIMTAGS